MEKIARMLSVPEREHKSQDMVAVQQELDHRLILLAEPLVPNKPEPLDRGSKPEPLLNMLCDQACHLTSLNLSAHHSYMRTIVVS